MSEELAVKSDSIRAITAALIGGRSTAILRDTWDFRALTWALAKIAVRNRYQRTHLGILWAMAGPVALALIIGFVWGRLLGREFADYVPYLFGGLLVWQFVTECSARGCGSLIGSAGYVKQTSVPLAVYPLRSILESYLNLLLALTGFSILLCFLDPYKLLGLITALPGLFLLLLFGAGIGLTQAVLGTILRDHLHLSVIGFRILFYLTPILYTTDLIDRAGISSIYRYNPIFYLIESVRQPYLTGQFPRWENLAVGAILALASLSFGFWLLGRIDRRLIAHL